MISTFHSNQKESLNYLHACIDNVHIDILIHSPSGLRKCQIHHHFLGSTKAKLGFGKVLETASLEVCIAENFPKKFFRVDGRAILPVLAEALWAES